MQPCCGVSYAVNAVANAVQPLASTPVVLVGAGWYGPGSCGAVATRPLRISGAGSGTTIVDCGGSGRLLLTNDSVAVTGLTVTGGNVSVSFVDPVAAYDDSSDTPNDDYQGPGWAVVGGGGIAVAWAPGAASKHATFDDVVWLSNVVSVQVVGGGSGAVLLGGGGLSVTGGGSGCLVALQGCAAGRYSVPCACASL